MKKKIKIHIRNNHWKEDFLPCDMEGEKHSTITKEEFEKGLNQYPEIRDQIEYLVDWDEDNYILSMKEADILLSWQFPTENLKEIAPNLKCFTPGIRIRDTKDDQKRTMNANEAIMEGSDCLIIGRPITKGDPKENIKNILSSID